MMKFTTLISVFLVLLISTNLFSATNIKDDNPEIFKLINETSIDSAYIKSGAVILLKESYTQISNEGLSYSTLHVIGKILDKKAKQDYSQIPIFFNSFYCDISMEYARTIKPDGTIISVSQDAVQIKDYPSTEAITYTDEKFLSFSLPGLDIGTAFEYKIIYQDKKNVVENNWLEGYSFYNVLHSVIPPYIPRIDPIIKSIQVLDVPRGEKFQIALDNITIDTEKSTTDKYDRYTWQAENMPAFKIDYGMPYLYDQLPYLRLTSIDSWEIVGKWAYQKIMTKAEITEEIKSLASDLTNAKETEEQKIESIYEFIQNKIDYVQSDLMRSGYMPHYSYETLTNKYGDCKDQATLLIALLRAINIDAYPALLNTAYHGKTRLDFPNPYFNHLIVYIPGMSKKGIWLDTTSDVTPFNRLLSSNMDCEAFIVKKENSEFIKTPTSELSVNFSDASINFDFYDDTIKTRINIEANGSLGDFYKSMFLHTTDEEKSNFVNDFLYNFNKNRKNDYYKFYNIDDNHFPFKLEISFTNDDVWQRSLFFFTFGPHSYFSIPLFFGFESLPLPENRQQDLQLSTIANVKNRETYPPPTADFTANLLPDNYEFSSQYIDFSKDFSYQGDSVIVDWHLALKKSLIKAKDYKEFYSDVQNIIKQINWQVKFSRKFEVFNLPKKEEEQEEQQKFRISAIVVASETEARDILGKLKQGSEFKELAAKYSIGPGKDNGGDLGYFNEGDLFDVLDEAAKPLEKGQMSDVIKTSTGYFIIQKTDILQQKEIEEIANFENLIEQAKKEIKSKQYEESLSFLEKAIKLQPENPEVNYLLGYSQLMINFPGASSIETLDRSTAEKSIKYLKNVIRITPKYDGEIFDKDPYSLLSKVYGALALSYLLNSKTDSMKWAFKEGTNSGAFSKSKLEFYQNTLLSCSENSLLFTENDYHYYNFLYLQQLTKSEQI